MLLGVFVHTALILPLFVKDLSQMDGQALVAVYQVIHVFRIPAFFILAGIFAAALLAKSGYRGFITSRFKRVVSVLITAEIIIASILIPAGCEVCTVTGSSLYLDNAWLHLWFLAYLVLISHFALLLDWLLMKFQPERVSTWKIVLANRLSFNPLAILLFVAVSLLLPNFLEENGTLRMSFALIPDVSLLLLFAVFFFVGWIAFSSIDRALASIRKFAWINVGIGLASAAFLLWPAPKGLLEELGSVLYALTMWFVAVGIIGLFVRFVPTRTKILGYFSDTSYWVYLWHPIFVLLFAWLFSFTSSNIWVQFVSIAVSSIAITSISFDVWVRNTVIGKWLSGRRRRELVSNVGVSE